MSIEFEPAEEKTYDSADPLSVIDWQVMLISKCIEWNEANEPYDQFKEDIIKTMMDAFAQISASQKIIKKQLKKLSEEIT